MRHSVRRGRAQKCNFLRTVAFDEALRDLLLGASQGGDVRGYGPWDAHHERKLATLLEDGATSARNASDPRPTLGREHQRQRNRAIGKVELVERALAPPGCRRRSDPELGSDYLLWFAAENAHEDCRVIRAQARVRAIETSDEVNPITGGALAPGSQPPAREVFPDLRKHACR